MILYMLILLNSKSIKLLTQELSLENLLSLWYIIKNTNNIKLFYSNFCVKVLCRNELSEALQVTTSVKRAFMLSHFLFILGIHWIMNKATVEGSHGLRWTLFDALEALDFADDIVH